MQTIQIIKRENYGIIALNRGKVNAINALMVEELREAVQDMHKAEEIRGLILTGLPHFFSAGLDVIELYSYDQQQIRDFLTNFIQLHIDLVRFPKPLICALTGHAPAGGTVMAVAADYRIMAIGDKYRIGLNEMAVNIQVSQNLVDAYGYWIGKRLAHQYIMEGKLLSTEEALACGLVDELQELEEVLPRAEAKMQQYLRALDPILHKTKFKLKSKWLKELGNNGKAELEEALTIWWSPEVRARMKQFVDSLSNRKSK